jgi:hypothetical protein
VILRTAPCLPLEGPIVLPSGAVKFDPWVKGDHQISAVEGPFMLVRV